MENSTFKLKIITPQGIFFEDDVKGLTVKTPIGEAGILKNHAPFVSTIEVSTLTINSVQGKVSRAAISGGIIYVERTHTSIITDNIEYDKDINVNAEKSHLENLKKMIADKSNKDNISELQKSIEHTLNRISIKNKSID